MGIQYARRFFLIGCFALVNVIVLISRSEKRIHKLIAHEPARQYLSLGNILLALVILDCDSTYFSNGYYYILFLVNNRTPGDNSTLFPVASQMTCAIK